MDQVIREDRRMRFAIETECPVSQNVELPPHVLHLGAIVALVDVGMKALQFLADGIIDFPLFSHGRLVPPPFGRSHRGFITHTKKRLKKGDRVVFMPFFKKQSLVFLGDAVDLS